MISSEKGVGSLSALSLIADSDKGARAASAGSHEGTLASYDRTGTLVLMTLAKGCIAVLLADTFRIVDLIKVSFPGL